MTIKSVVIIGSGNVAWHLVNQTQKYSSHIVIKEMIVRNESSNQDFVNIPYRNTMVEMSTKADLYVLCVKDDAIEKVVNSFPFLLSKDQMVAHTSGSVPSTFLSPLGPNFGVLWPIQTLTKNVALASQPLPFGITASNENTKNTLANLVENISGKPYSFSDDERKKMHLSAVFINNFSNHLYSMIFDFCKKNNLNFNVFESLMLETVKKSIANSPRQSQTGPAIRNDSLTIQKHINILKDEVDLLRMYEIFTMSIQKDNK